MQREKRKIIEGQIRECFGRVVYSHKTHEKCADILLDRLAKIKLAQIVLSAITTGGFLATVFGGGIVAAFIGIVVSTSLLVLNAYTKDYDLGELAQKHKQSASNLWLVREKYLSLLTAIYANLMTDEEIINTRDELMNDSCAIYEAAPATTSNAYQKAQEALQINEDYTFSNEEIDKFLPNELKKAHNAMMDTDSY